MVTIFDVEDRLRRVPLRCIERRIVPLRIPLFNVSAWKVQ
jgi:hypothetical protein